LTTNAIVNFLQTNVTQIVKRIFLI